MGPPGAGKGTQAQRLVEDFDLPYYATGDILRAAVREESELGREAKDYMERGDLVTAELMIEAPDEEVIRRLSGRRICVKNQHLYHVEFDPPKREGVCDQDGSRLIQRDDDKPETVQRRLDVYREQTQPLADRYEKAG